MHKAKSHIVRFKWIWRTLRILEAVLAASGVAAGLWLSTGNPLQGVSIAAIIGVIWIILARPWHITNLRSAEYLDIHDARSEFSAGLLLYSPDALTPVARLQQRKVAAAMTSLSGKLPPNHLLYALSGAVLCILLGYIVSSSEATDFSAEESVPLYSHAQTDPAALPEIQAGSITIAYPAYTGRGTVTEHNLSVNTLEGAALTWKVEFAGTVDSLFMENEEGSSIAFAGGGDTFSLTITPDHNLLYTLRVVRDTLTAVSEVFYVKLLPDLPPQIDVVNMQDYVEFAADHPAPVIHVEAEITDEYGLSDAYVVATVTRGSGESVKFREEVLRFRNKITGRRSHVSMDIRLDSLGMQPGDELYYYLEALDNREPVPRSARTETRFAVITDTLAQEFISGGSMSADLMPDYFRSQRQIILDTEALLAGRSSTPEQEFRQESNALGYDQKVLRIKYAQYLGDEFESEIGPAAVPGQAAEDPDEDPAAAYTHDHDHEEEGGIPEEISDENEDNDPLEAFIHDHSNPEEATLYTQGVRAMLKQAVAEMWDAELYLRLYQPEKSLPFQYKALDLIQKIKNQARIYVHRIGFDPPPIKEEARLTADLGEIGTPRRQETSTDPYASIREAIRILNNIQPGDFPEPEIREPVFESAANEVAALALENPGQYLDVLSSLRKLRGSSPEELMKAAAGIKAALSTMLPGEPDPGSAVPGVWSGLDSLFQVKMERSRGD